MRFIKFYAHLIFMCLILNYFVWEPAGLFKIVQSGSDGMRLIGMIGIFFSLIIVCVTVVNFSDIQPERDDR